MQKIKSTIVKILFNDAIIFGIILLNSITIFLEGFSGIPPLFMLTILIVDSLITLIFIAEAAVKIKVLGWPYYIASAWNKLDFILVTLSLPSIFIFMFPDKLGNLSFLLVLRITRVFKFIRFFKFIPGIDHLAAGIGRAMKASVFVLLGFLVYNFIVSVFSYYIFRDLAPEYFGNPLLALYNTFKIFTVEGWYEIPEIISVDLNDFQAAFTMFYFVFILITGGILGLSLVNSIFVDSMVSDNNDELEAKVDQLEAKIDQLLAHVQNQNKRKD